MIEIPKLTDLPIDIPDNLKFTLQETRNLLDVLLGRQSNNPTLLTLQGKRPIKNTGSLEYFINGTDFGKSIRMTSAGDTTYYLPTVDASYDGARITFIRLGAGDLTIQASGNYVIATSGIGGNVVCSTTDTYDSITLEYCHLRTQYIIVYMQGTWVVS